MWFRNWATPPVLIHKFAFETCPPLVAMVCIRMSPSSTRHREDAMAKGKSKQKKLAKKVIKKAEKEVKKEKNTEVDRSDVKPPSP
jgi:hypothetical protein